MDTRIGPARFPAIEIRLRFFQALEAQSFERSFLCVPHARFHFPFAIGIFDPARHGHDAVVCEHIPKQWIESGIVDVRSDDALAQIIENHDARTPTKSTKGLLMQLGPDAGTRTPDQQTYGFAAVAQGQHEQSCPSVLAALRVPHHRTRTVIDLGLFSCGGEDDPHRFWQLRSAQLAHKALHRLVAAGKAVIGNQVLPDGHGIPATTQPLLDQFAVGLAGTGSSDRGCQQEMKSAGQSRWSPRWPVLTRQGRWSPHWPVLPALAVPTHPVVAPRSRLPLGKRLLFHDVHQWLARCAARAIRASPVR